MELSIGKESPKVNNSEAVNRAVMRTTFRQFDVVVDDEPLPSSTHAQNQTKGRYLIYMCMPEVSKFYGSSLHLLSTLLHNVCF